MRSSRPRRPGAISGVTLIGGEPAELVDTHWLFAHHLGATARPAEQAVCRLPTDDPWMQNILRPIVEAAGYRVVGEDHDAPADLVIARKALRLKPRRPRGRSGCAPIPMRRTSAKTAFTVTIAPDC